MKPLSVSVVVPAYNAEATIGNMLSALMNQSGKPPDTEFIIVDNGSTDNTLDVIRKFQVTLLQASKRGPAAARNCGLRAARGDIIAHCDADTQPTRRWLAEIVAPFNDPQVMLAAGKTLAFEPQNSVERYFARADVYDAEKYLNRPLLPFVGSLNMAVRRLAALEIDGWDEAMMTTEDVDFSYRLLQKFPGPIQYAPRALLFHRNRSTVSGLQQQAWTYGEGSAKLYAKYSKTLPWGWRQSLQRRRNLIMSAGWPHFIRLTHWLGLASSDAVEFAKYQSLWIQAFWTGFYSFQRHDEFRPLPQPRA